MFSARSSVLAEPNPLALALAERRARGEPVLDLTISNPTAAGLPYESERLLAALNDPGALRYAPEPFGLTSAREALAQTYLESGIALGPTHVALTASTSEAYGFAFKLLCDPGDEVLLPAPSYPLLEHLARLEHLSIRPYTLFYDHGWHVDIDSVKRALSAKTRAIVVVHPNNPTGSYLKRNELEALLALDVPIVSDEVFASYAFADDAARLSSVLEVLDEGLVIALDGLSKRIGLPQLKLGWMALGGNPAAVESALGRLELIADTYLSVSTPVQLALPELLAAGASTRSAILKRVRRNHLRLPELLADSAVSTLQAEGGWYAILRLPRVRSEDEWVLGLLELGVLVQPGYFYDFADEAYVVVSLLTPEPSFDAGVERLRNYVGKES
jgi:alanine-synthesizing transaminase